MAQWLDDSLPSLPSLDSCLVGELRSHVLWLHAPQHKKRGTRMDALTDRERPPKAVLPSLQEGSSLTPTGQYRTLFDGYRAGG